MLETENVDVAKETSEQGLPAVFDSEDTGVDSMLAIKSDLKMYKAKLDIDDILVPTLKKVGRSKTVIGLTGIIEEWGVVSPIHVLKLEDEDTYQVLDGVRRLFGALRAGLDEIDAVVWDFDDKVEGKDKANLLSLMINRSQRFNNKELWEQMQILEEVNGAAPNMVEFLLQMQAGDAMKLKDIMMADVDYMEIQDDLMSGELTIDGAYKKLCKQRREENRLAKEDATTLEGGSSASIEDISDEQKLSADDVKDLLDLTDGDVSDSTLEDLDRTDEVSDVTYQDVNDRKPLDPKIKQATMIRDKFKCRCCGLGGHSGWAGILVYHHVVPVFLNGPDTVDNGLTLCSNCHVTLHLYSFGKVSVDLDTLDDKEKQVFRNIFKYGNIIIEGMKRSKMNKDVAYKADAGSRRHLYPGEGLKDNKETLKVLEDSKG